MAYIKTVYQDSPSTATPLNAQNLNNAEDGIENNDRRITAIEGAYVSGFNGRTGAIVPADNDYNIGQIAPLTGAQVGQVPVVTNIGTEEDPELVFRMGAGGGGGHSIIDSEGNTMPQETAMQFADSHVSDDETNGRTVVENVKELTLAELSQATERGMYLATDEESVPYPSTEEDVVSVTADGVKTIGDLLNELAVEVNWGNVTDGAYISETLGTTTIVFTHYRHTDSSATFYYGGSASGGARVGSYTVRANNSSAEVSTGTSYSDVTATQKPSNGTVITLHYGTSSGTVELNTDARHCMMSDGQSVEDAIAPSGYSTDELTFTDCTLVNGGYFKIGKMVVLNIRVEVTASSSATKAYIGLPNKITPLNSVLVGLTAQQSTDDLPPIFSVISIGKIFMKGTTANKEYVISGTWHT